MTSHKIARAYFLCVAAMVAAMVLVHGHCAYTRILIAITRGLRHNTKVREQICVCDSHRRQ